MMQPQWKQILLFIKIITMLVGAAVAVKADNACHFWDDTPRCSQHHLQCDQGAIFITKAIRGFKRKSNACPNENTNCVDLAICCNDTGQDCLKEYEQDEFSYLAGECWNQQSCHHTVQRAGSYSCGNSYRNWSGYSKVQYLCLADSAIHDFSDSNTMTASSLALRYLSSSDSQSYVCQVEAKDCSPRTAGVMLAKNPNRNYFWDCSSLKVNDEDWLPCSTSIRYATYTLTTPFRVWLKFVNNNDVSQAWAVIHGKTASTLQVTCKPWKDKVSFPKCSPATAPTTSPEKTTPITESRTTVSSAAPDTTSAADVQPLSTSSVASVSSADVSGENMPQSSDTSSNTAGIVGGVVGAVLVVLVVVALVVTLVFLKRSRGTQGKTTPKIVTWFRGGNSSGHYHGNSPTAATPESGRAVLHVAPAQPTSLPAYDNSLAAIADEERVRVDPGSDYSHLRQKPTSSTARDVTYGHLADSDVYGYDHVTKGKPAVRSGDVINNVYDTAGPATGAPSDEDFYNVTGAAKNWPDVINNVYNTPSPATEASSDGDYYNVTGLPEAGRDVIDNVYDTPKPAAVPGPGETEACDVTGVDAGSPYEFARDMK